MGCPERIKKQPHENINPSSVSFINMVWAGNFNQKRNKQLCKRELHVLWSQKKVELNEKLPFTICVICSVNNVPVT